MTSRSSTGKERAQPDPDTPQYIIQVDDIQTSSTSVPPQHAEQEQGDKANSGSENPLQDGPPSSGSAKEKKKTEKTEESVSTQDMPAFPDSAQEQTENGMVVHGNQPQNCPPLSGSVTRTSKNEEMGITNIQATNITLGLRRLPACFCITVRHSGLEWRTESKPSSAKDDVEWSERFPTPLDPSATVCLKVYASFEFQPMLDIGEELQRLTVTVEQILDCGEKHIPFTLFPGDGDVVSPCSSIAITVERHNDENHNSSVSRSSTNTPDELEEATNHGHSALSRYQMHGRKRDLQHFVVEFERALNPCPLNHPCHVAVQSNLAMAKFILCQVDGPSAPFEIPLDSYHSALVTHPVGHTDLPPTLIQLAAVHFTRFEKQRNGIDRTQVEAVLHETTGVRFVDSHEEQAVSFILQLYAGHGAGPEHASGESLVSLCSGDEDLWDLSFWLLERFEQYSDLADLQQAVTLLQKMVRSVSVWDDRCLAGLGKLGAALLWRFQQVGEPRDLEDAISTHKNATHLTPDGHPDKPGCLNNLGHSLITRFERLGERNSDLEDAISVYKDAVRLTPDGHFDKPGRLNSLWGSFTTRFRCFGEPRDLKDAISTLRDTVNLIPDSHPDKAGCLNNLGLSYVTRFECLGELRDLEDAILTFGNAVYLAPDSHPSKPVWLSNLGLSFGVRFERLGALRDLQDAILTYKDAVRLAPDDYPDKLVWLNSLGLSFNARFERLGELEDLKDVISTYRDVVLLTFDDHPYKSIGLNYLGLCFRARFEHLGELGDLEDAISTHQDAVRLSPGGDPEPVGLTNLGSSFFSRFECLGELGDLEGAISSFRDAVRFTPDGHPDKLGCLNSLALAFSARFEHLGELEDLEDAISTLRDAVCLTPEDHPQKAKSLNNLGLSLVTRFEHLGELVDLDDAISVHRDAVCLTPEGQPCKPGRLNNLGFSLITRFEHLGELGDLEDAISTHRDAVRLTPDGHHDKLRHLNNLGSSFITRFDRLGELRDLEDAISTYKDAVRFTPDGHPHKPSYLNNLGDSSRARFERLGELRDLEDAISTHKDAARLTPDGHPDKPHGLNCLGNSFITRFHRLGELGDLEDAISAHKDAVRLTPVGHPGKVDRLNSLGLSFITRFEWLGELGDLEDAISTHRNAVRLTPDGHSNKPGSLNNLGLSFRARFEHFGELEDLEDAVSTHRNAVRLIPDDHPHKPGYLNNLGLSLIARFERTGKLGDLEEAISTHRDAVRFTPDGHPDKPHRLNNLSFSFVTRFERLGEPCDLACAISLYSHSASFPIGPIHARFHASQQWISCARRVHHPSLLRAYSIAINLLPQLAWIGLSLPHRYTKLKRGSHLVCEAAAAALDSGFPELAVEWLEQGRSIVWGELFHLRGSHEELSSAHPEYAHKLQELSAALDDAGATRERSFSTVERAQFGLSAMSATSENASATNLGSCPLETAQTLINQARRSLEHAANRQRTLALDRDDLLQEIRRFPGFERFLLPSDFSQLRASAHSGPIVILNAAASRCDALIVLPGVDHVIHVPLPRFNLQRSVGFQNALTKLLGDARVIPFDDRKGDRATWRSVNWEFFLSTLWTGVIKPVLDALAFSIPEELSRIFWCPTGPFVFLPIHAAGLYGVQYSSPGHKVSDFVVSSYVPTLSILAQSPGPSVLPSGDLRILAIPQPHSDGQKPLRGVAPELNYIRTIVGSSPSACTTFSESSMGTVEEVLELMEDADWVHFACHGVQDATRSTDSGLCLANERRLRISDIIGLSRPRGGLAFLSACQTAMGDNDLSDEAIHIAAGMLFAGYGGVIGTMWSISDRYAPVVTRDVYQYLFRNGTRPDHREAAWALHEAVGRLRERCGEESFATWLPFIHVGL